jgi:hypothetical protein
MNWLAAFEKAQLLRGAIASVSLSHEQDCTCDTCKAARGDEEAFARVAASSGELFGEGER